jgi:Plasmid maintenance system killer protein
LPGNRFEALVGDRKGQYSIRINDQWRICFEWADRSPGALKRGDVDYH